MDKKVGNLFLVLAFLAVLAVAHTVTHFYVWGASFYGISIGGLAIDGIEDGNEPDSFFIGVSLSQLFVVMEWVSVFILFFVFFSVSRVTLKKETEELARAKAATKMDGTVIDVLYNILRDKHRLNFEAIKSVFNVDMKIVERWAETLKSGNLAEVEYPRVGGPELVLKR